MTDAEKLAQISIRIASGSPYTPWSSAALKAAQTLDEIAQRLAKLEAGAERDEEIFRSRQRAGRRARHGQAARTDRLRKEVLRLRPRVAELEAQKDAAYTERNDLVVALAKCFPSCLARHPDEDEEWEDDWRWIVVVTLPAGQATWHIHDSELFKFTPHLEVSDHEWDGHTTEEKYRRLGALPTITTLQADTARLTEERDEAIANAKALDVWGEGLEAMVTQLRSPMADQDAIGAPPEADTVRLDWLQDHSRGEGWGWELSQLGEGYGIVLEESLMDARFPDIVPTVRSVIDAAREGE